ncbi:MAG: hypothetical protein WCC99_20800 [Candidatus Sulfotelmatobacter sp.]
MGSEFLRVSSPHNASMPLGEGLRRTAPVSRLLQLLSTVVCLSLLLFPLAARARPAALNPQYVAALAAADHFLQAWQAGDSENGVAALTRHAKDAATSDAVDRFFSASAPVAYEIGRGKLLKHGRYEFPVVLVSGTPNSGRVRRRFSSIVIVNTGNNDWAVDKLP